MEDYYRTKRAMEAIRQEELQELPEETREELLDRAQIQQMQLREEFSAAHKIPQVTCEMCGRKVREDETVYIRVCSDCVHIIRNAIELEAKQEA